jgi:serine/threonine-protein kinase
MSADEELDATVTEGEAASGVPRPTGFDALAVTDRYTLVSVKGRGASGVVWVANDKVLQRDVALKILNRRPDDDDTESKFRFVYESRVTARLAHPSIISIHDAGLLPDGRFYYAMPLASGQTLKAVLDQLRAKSATAEAEWPLPRLLRILIQVCNAVAYAHDRGVIHRDLKPDNLLLGDYGEVYIADWGIARAYRHGLREPVAQRDGTETHVGRLLGTPRYMSPEQLAGETETLTPASDVYSLGVILYEMLTLHVPFAAENIMALIFALATSSTPNPAERFPEKCIPAVLALLCRDALHREVEVRTITAVGLAKRLTAYLDGVEETRRKAASARESLSQAVRIANAYRLRCDSLETERHQIQALADALPVTAPMSERRRIWQRLQDIEQARMDVEGLHLRGIQLAVQSLIDFESAEARDALADLYWLKVEDARRAMDDHAEAYFRALVEQNDTGRYRDRLSAQGELEIRAPADSITMRVPFLVEGNRRCQLVLDPPRRFAGSEAYVPIWSAGATIGADRRSSAHLPKTRLGPMRFLMGRYPVTIREYVEFLNALAEISPEAALRHVPRSAGRAWLAFDPSARRFDVPTVDENGDRWDPDWPVEMIDWHDAVAYCAWRTEREGRLVRLPTDEEWELAARGVDRRAYPWGNGFDPALCMMDRSQPGRRLPLPVCSFEFDCSPFGVQDMAGLVFEWTGTLDPADPSRAVQRGGSRRSPEDWCRAGVRRFPPLDTTTPLYGFRVASEWPT